jgi:cGAMP-activated phospholipase
MPFQILSLSGGGYLGLYTISVLADLEDRIHAPLATRFDLIAGTSVGGIIAIGIANEVPAASIKDAFERNKSFQQGIHPRPRAVGSMMSSGVCLNRNTIQAPLENDHRHHRCRHHDR